MMRSFKIILLARSYGDEIEDEMDEASCTHRTEEKRNAYKVLVVKPKGKRPLERPMCRRDGSIGTDLTETGREIVDWIRHTQNSD
jgi:hypothetical protein